MLAISSKINHAVGWKKILTDCLIVILCFCSGQASLCPRWHTRHGHLQARCLTRGILLATCIIVTHEGR